MARKARLGMPLATLQNAPDTREGRRARESADVDGLVRDKARLQDEIAELQARAPVRIEPTEISESRFRDRIDVTQGLDGLVDSIREHGQTLPVLVRTKSEGPLPYEVVYGRRRIAACRKLGIRVQALVTDMSDDESLMAQGLENAQRLETSYIERALFADQIRQAGKTEAEIASILGIGKSSVSRMKTLVEALPFEIVSRLGPVPDGRRRWDALQSEIAALDPATDLNELADLVDTDTDLDKRLEALTRAIAKYRRHKAKSLEKESAAQSVKEASYAGGAVRARPTPTGLTLKISKNKQGFATFLESKLDELFEEFEKG